MRCANPIKPDCCNQLADARKPRCMSAGNASSSPSTVSFRVSTRQVTDSSL